MDPNVFSLEQMDGQGFKNAPVSKAYLVVLFASAFLVQLSFDSADLVFSYEDVFINLEIWKLLLSVFCFVRLHQAIFAGILVYKFRQIERNVGSNHFLILLCCNALFSILLSSALTIVYPLTKWDFGPTPFLSGLFVFYFAIPPVGSSRFFLTNKTLTYLVGIQIAVNSDTTMIGTLLGILSGVLVKLNFLWCQKLFSFIHRIKLSSEDALIIDFTNFPATIEAQQVHMAEQWQRRMTSRPRPLDAQAVTRLVEMGFSQELATDALRQNNNNVEQAIVSLLTRPSSSVQS